jgi:hypothetical protein
VNKGAAEKDMPAFATVPQNQLKDIAEFSHLQVERWPTVVPTYLLDGRRYIGFAAGDTLYPWGLPQ